jgi:hypothetical protein
MKNDWAIIKSDLTKEEKEVAEKLLDLYRHQKGTNFKKTIKQYRIDYIEFGYTYSEKSLSNACAFHNKFNEYSQTIK